MADRLPAIFLGHGNPLNAIATNSYTDGDASGREYQSHERSTAHVP